MSFVIFSSSTELKLGHSCIRGLHLNTKSFKENARPYRNLSLCFGHASLGQLASAKKSCNQVDGDILFCLERYLCFVHLVHHSQKTRRVCSSFLHLVVLFRQMLLHHTQNKQAIGCCKGQLSSRVQRV